MLLRVESRAGHGKGKPVPKQADVLGFLFHQLGVEAPSPSSGPDRP